MSFGTNVYTCSDFSHSINAVAWSPDELHLAAVGSDENVYVWDVKTWASVDLYPVSDFDWNLLYQMKYLPQKLLLPQTYGRTQVIWHTLKWSLDGNYFFAGLLHPINIFSLHKEASHSSNLDITKLLGSPHVTNAAGFDALGLVITSFKEASQKHNGLDAFWDDTLNVLSIEASPDGKRTAFGNRENTIEVYESETGQVLLTYTAHMGGVMSMAWSPDGTSLASGSFDRSIRVWNVDTGDDMCVCAGHSNSVLDVCWSPDGKQIASSSWDKTVRIWDARTGACTYVYKGHTGPVNSVSWSPDGRYLASGSWDHTMQVWQATEDKADAQM